MHSVNYYMLTFPKIWFSWRQNTAWWELCKHREKSGSPCM